MICLRVIRSLGIGSLLAIFCLPSFGATKTLAIYNWEDYLAPEVIEAFNKAYQAEIKVIHYDSDEIKDQWLAQTGGVGIDVIVSSASTMDSYPKLGWLAPIDREKVPNIKHIENRWLDFNPGLKGYAVPYMWGSVGIVYRNDLIPEGISSWGQIFDPDSPWRSKLMLIDDSREVFGMALRSLNESINTTNLQAIEKAGKLLSSNAQLLRFGYLSLDENNRLDRGDVWVAMVYSGDGLMLSERSDKVSYVLPQEGSYLWQDYIGVGAKSENKDLAWDFINFINQPEMAAKQSEYVQFATPNQAAKKFMSRKHLENEAVYPSADKLARSEVLSPKVSAKVIKKINNMYSRIQLVAGQ